MKLKKVSVPILITIILIFTQVLPLLATPNKPDLTNTLVVSSIKDPNLEKGNGLNIQNILPSKLDQLSESDVLEFEAIVINQEDLNKINQKVLSNAFDNGLSVFVTGHNLSGEELNFIVPTPPSKESISDVGFKAKAKGDIRLVGLKNTESLLSFTMATDFDKQSNALDTVRRSEVEHQKALLRKTSKQELSSGLQIEPGQWDKHYFYPDYYSEGWVAVNIYAKRQADTGSSHTWDVDTIISTNPDNSNGWATKHLALGQSVSYSGEQLQQRTPDSIGTPGSSYGLSLTWGYPSVSWSASADGLANITNSWPPGNYTQWDTDYTGAAASGSKDFEAATRSTNTSGSFYNRTSYTVTWVNSWGTPIYSNRSYGYTISILDF